MRHLEPHAASRIFLAASVKKWLDAECGIGRHDSGFLAASAFIFAASEEVLLSLSLKMPRKCKFSTEDTKIFLGASPQTHFN